MSHTTTIKIQSVSRDDALIALREVTRQLEEGFTSGFNCQCDDDPERTELSSFSWDSDLPPD